MKTSSPTDPAPKKKRGWLWLWVTGAFVLLITSWTLLILIAVRNAPEKVPLETEVAETVSE
jgi:hypothetical protein